MSFQLEKDKFYSMPVSFGLPGKNSRDMIHADEKTGIIELDQFIKATAHTLVYETKAETIQRFLPNETTVDQPYVIVTHRMNRNFPGLAGKGYNLIQVTVPVLFHGKKDHAKGNFVLAIWESHPDPCTLGRDMLGYPKLSADVTNAEGRGGKAMASATNWGYQFVRMDFDFSEPCNSTEELKSILQPGDSDGEINYVFRQRIGSKLELDSDYYTILPKAKELVYPFNVGNIPAPLYLYGTGSIEWGNPRYEDMPIQAHVIQGLASMPILRMVGAMKSEYYHLGDYSAVRIIE